MAKKVVKRCVIVCASPDADAEFIKRNIRPDDYVMAADGGMRALNKAGVIPDLFVGDFDSFDGGIPADTELIRLNTHKDDTDSMHCAGLALDRGFNNIVLLGATGGMLSHTFSNFAVLSYLEDNGARAEILDENESVRILNSGEYIFINLIDREFSVFPFGCSEVTVTYKGEVEYPAVSLKLCENSSLGKSNVFRSNSVVITVESGKAIIFFSR